MMRWWWFGPAVENAEIEREILAMKAGGIGGFEVQPVYPLALDAAVPNLRNHPFLSSRFLASLRHASEIARREDLRMDLTLGSGWPFGGPHITAALAASQLRLERVQVPAGATELLVPSLNPGESRIAVLIGALGTDPKADRPLKPLRADSQRLSLEPGEQPREALIFITGPTGQQVKRPAVGAEGFVLDHLNPAAVARHLSEVGEPLLTALGKRPPYAVFSDSLEAYGSSWTPDLPAEFRNRRGYDLLAHLPALFLDGPESSAVRYDWALTLAELVDERYLTVVDAWAKRRGTRFRAQVYGIPPVTLSSNRLVTLPEGEGSPWRSFTSTRWATSGAHLYDRPVVSSEVWTWLHSPAWAATPLDMKVEADRHFLQGVTQLVGHGWPYSPPAVGEPGWAFYAAAALNDHNPWYAVMPDVMRYLQRISYVLRQGTPANSVGVFLPTEDALAGITPERASVNEWIGQHLHRGIIESVLDSGNGFDFIDSDAVLARGIRHKVLVLPPMARIKPSAYRKILDWAEAGGVVVAMDNLPSLAAGLRASKAESVVVQELSNSLAKQSRAVMTDLKHLQSALTQVARPDVRLSAPEDALGFVHRRIGTSDIYFVANTSNLPVIRTARFLGDRGNGAWWDPIWGRRWASGTGEIQINLAPYESRLLVFGGQPAGKVPQLEQTSTALTGHWTLQIANRPPVPLADFRSWTEDRELVGFSGTAVYRNSFRLSDGARHCLGLDFGAAAPQSRGGDRGTRFGAAVSAPIRDAAIVFVNGHRAGSLWAPPYRIDVSNFLKSGENQLEVHVSNSAINALAARPRDDYRSLTARYGERFEMQDVDRIRPALSGLLAPVSLISGACTSG